MHIDHAVFAEFMRHFTLSNEQLPMASDIPDHYKDIFVNRQPMLISSEMLDNASQFGHGEVMVNNAPVLIFNVYRSDITSSLMMSRPKDDECVIIVNDKMFTDSKRIMEPKMRVREMVYRLVHRYMAKLRPLEQRELYNPVTKLTLHYLTEPFILDVAVEDQSFFNHKYGIDLREIDQHALYYSIFYSLAHGGVNLKELEIDVESLISCNFDEYVDVLKHSIDHLTNPFIHKEMANRIKRLHQMKEDIKAIRLPEELHYETCVTMY